MQSGCRQLQAACRPLLTAPSPCRPQARILQLLVSLPDREERTALLPEAFTPAEEPAAAADAAAAAACAGSQCVDSAEDEELLSTTPLALLQVGGTGAGCPLVQPSGVINALMQRAVAVPQRRLADSLQACGQLGPDLLSLLASPAKRSICTCCTEANGHHPPITPHELRPAPASLQAIDLQLSRLSQPAPQGAAGLLAGATFSDVSPAELEQRLQQLREDVAVYWERATDLGNTSGEDW